MTETTTTKPIEDDADEAKPSLLEDEQGATSLEYALLLAVIAIPSVYVIQQVIDLLVGHYQMMTMINSLPFP